MILYVSDLDGTLLNKNAKLTDYSQKTINQLMETGMNFTVATARTYATVSKILNGLNVNAPIILMNGALIRDLQKDEYVYSAIIDNSVSKNIITIIHEMKLYGFMYTIQNGDMVPYYEEIATPEMRAFYEERKNRYYKQFLQTSDFGLVNDNSLYFSFINKKENLMPFYDKIKDFQDIKLTFYRDVYSDDLWYLEIFSPNASKENAVNFLKSQYGYDKIICFGDNLNDISLFNASNRKYAVENAAVELKQLADEIVGSNDSDGVAKFLKDNYGKDF
ncbi:MAG: HAD family hydrolase [Ruminococcus sp.]|nr:HAD family hydrolase [Ruminococcus sp.]